MKYIDKFLKKLNTDRNTFATYVLTLISVYLAVDRIVEMLLMIFTGVSYSYWGPIKYLFALSVPVFAFAFAPSSKFASNKTKQVTLFYVYAIGLYIIAISMFTQWLNMGAWLLLLSVPNYTELITEFSDLVKPAMVSLSLYLPLVTIFPLFKGLYFGVNDSKDRTRSIWDYAGINLADKNKGHGPYTCDVYICTDDETGKKIVMPESSRYQSLFVCGGSGSGKTSLVYEPLIAKDIERKSFYREISKELGIASLKAHIATLNKPYDNNYLNKNFNLNMLSPVEGKSSLFKNYFKKMIIDSSDTSNIVYRNLGLTLMSPDYEEIAHMIDVCNNFGFNYNLIDPNNASASIGLNPFVYDDASKIAVTISSALKYMYLAQHDDTEDSYREELSIQAIENLSMLLKEIYPKMNEGKLPNLEDLLKLLTNFDLIEKMCEILAHDENLKQKYSVQIAYFKKNFYKNAPGRENMEKYIYLATSQLDNLLRIPGVKTILCNRNNNINFDDMLANGDITFICTRRGDLGGTANRAFGLFFLLSMQNAVLRRPGNINNRIPHFLYIDEFSNFICRATEAMFTMYRKYKVATTISVQSLSQLDGLGEKDKFRSIILSNCANKIFTGNAEFDELVWWSNEFGTKREWTYSNAMDMDKMEYDPKYGNIKWEFVKYFKEGKLQYLGNTLCAYKICGTNGKPMVGPGIFSYLESKYKEPQKIKTYDFNKFKNNSSSESGNDDSNNRKKFNLKNINFTDENREIDPIQTDTTDSSIVFDNDDAIISNSKRRKNKK